MVELAGVSFAYSKATLVLRDVDVAFRPGCTLVLGPNGSGKSTLLRIAAGVERPDSGLVTIGGHDAWRDEVAARRDLAYVPEQPDLSPYASVREILQLVCRLRAQPSTSAEAALEAAGLAGHARRSVRELSMGQRRRAVLAAAFIGTPKVALLDEPLEALDRSGRHTVVEWVAGLVQRDGTVVLATHDFEPVSRLAVRAVTVSAGAVRVFDTLPADPEARLAYLGRLASGEPL